MAWSDAARRAAAEARRRKSRRFSGERERMKQLHKERQMNVIRGGSYFGTRVPFAPSVRSTVAKARDYGGSTRTQSRAIQSLARSGRSAYTGRKVGKRKARAIAARIGDWANE